MKPSRASLQTVIRSGRPRSSRSFSHILGMDPPTKRYCYSPTLIWNAKVEEYFIQAYGADHFSRISQSLTQPSCYSCIRVNTLKSSSDVVIEKLLNILQKTRPHSSFHNLQLSTVGDANATNGWKHQTDLGAWSEETLKLSEGVNPLGTGMHTGTVNKCGIPGLDYVLFIKGSGPHAIDYGYQQDRPPKEVIASRKCAEAVLRGAQVYVPGVLACSAHVEKGDVVAVSVGVEQPVPDGGWAVGITRGTILQGLWTDPYHNERSGLYVGKGTMMLSRAGAFRESSGLAVEMNDRVFILPSLNDVLEGEIFLQNLPSIVTVHALDPQPGERILDMCAAPGGKTTGIAIIMKDKGEVVAVDRSHNKVMEIQKLAEELGLSCITAYKLDALRAVYRSKVGESVTLISGDEVGFTVQDDQPPKSQMERIFSTGGEDSFKQAELGSSTGKGVRRIKNGPGRNQSSGGRVEKSQGFYPSTFDRVLLDAPCSALGLKPRLFAGEETVESLRNHAKYQRRMLDQAVQLVRSGGVIVYSTCTINPGENEALVRYALDTYKFLSLTEQHPKVGGPGLVGRCELSDGYIEEWLRPGEEDLVQRFDPSSALDTIGFFIAKFAVGPKEDAQLTMGM